MIPPPAPERLEQRGGIGEPQRLRLDQEDPRQVVLALRVKQGEVALRAVPYLLRRDLQRVAGGGFRVRLRLERHRVVFQRPEHVGHLAERLQDRLAILRRGLVEAGDLGAAGCPQRPAVEDGLQESCAESPDGGVRAEQVADPGRRRAVLTGQRDLRVEVRRGHADRRACRVQQLLGGSDVGPLAHQRRREAHGEFFRQTKLVQLEFGKIRRGVGKPSGKDREEVARLGETFLQRGNGRAGLRQGGPLGEHVGSRDSAQLELLLDQREQLFLRREDLPRRLQLPAQGGLLEGRGRDVGREGEAGALELGNPGSRPAPATPPARGASSRTGRGRTRRPPRRCTG